MLQIITRAINIYNHINTRFRISPAKILKINSYIIASLHFSLQILNLPLIRARLKININIIHGGRRISKVINISDLFFDLF